MPDDIFTPKLALTRGQQLRRELRDAVLSGLLCAGCVAALIALMVMFEPGA